MSASSSPKDQVKPKKVPCGATAVYVHEGRVIAHASDFNQSKPAGFSLYEAQASRARHALSLAVIRELSSPLLYKSMTSYIAEQIIREMPGSVEVFAVGPENCTGHEE